MLTVTPYKIPQCFTGNNKNRKQKVFGSNYFPNSTPIQTNIAETKLSGTAFALPWLKDATIFSALNYLKNLEFNKNDVAYIQSQGAILPFLSGKEALDFINNSNVRIKFATLASPKIHAQYDFENNFIKINELYKNTQNPAEILAIAEAILHEAGHAKDKDGLSSIQEEINCLALNAVSHRVLSQKYPNAFSSADSPIVKDGVCVYSELFFDKDPSKTKLVERIRAKYGFLPVGDFKHPPSALALKVKTAQVKTA